MKKLIFTIVIMLTATLFTVAQTTITVSGTVTNSANNAAVANHQVNIVALDSMTSFYFSQSVNTNSNGAYSVAIPNYPSSAIITASTLDCNNQTVYLYFGQSPYVANFSICVGSPATCQAAFMAFPDSSNQQTIHFIDQTTGTPTSWLWDFGDNTTSTLQNPTHTYTASQYYAVSLTVVCSNTTSTIIDTILVSGGTMPCQANFTQSANPTNPLMISFTNTSTGNPTSYSWNFGDNSTSTLQHPSHTYASSGTYNVTLSISGPGCQNTTSNTITIGGSPSNGIIFGQVLAGSNLADIGLVYLIEFNPITNLLTAIDTTNIDSGGYYGFTNVPFGSYYVKSALSPSSSYYSSYFPTYFGNQLLWSNATLVSLNTATTTANINLIAGTNPGGPGFIGGNVLQGANKGPGDPMDGINVMLLDMSDNAVTLDITDVNGEYGFNNIAYGNYKVWIDIPGKTTTPAVVTIDATTPSVNNINIIINSTTIVAGINSRKSLFDTNVGEIYPNPSIENSNLEINLKQATKINISIFSSIGQLISSETLELPIGKNLVNIPGSELVNGIYTIRLEANIGQVYRKFVKVTK